MIPTNPYFISWSPGSDPSIDAPFASELANEWWNKTTFNDPRAYINAKDFIMACATWRPDDYEAVLASPSYVESLNTPPQAWLEMMEGTRRFDSGIVAALETMLHDGANCQPHQEKSNKAVQAFRMLSAADRLRTGQFGDRILFWAKTPLFLSQTTEAVEVIATHFPADACRLVAEAGDHSRGYGSESLLRLAVKQLQGFGGVLIKRMLSSRYLGPKDLKSFEIILSESPVEEADLVRQILLDGAKGRTQTASKYSTSVSSYWKAISSHSEPVLGPLMHQILSGKVVAARQAAAAWIAREEKDALSIAETLLSSKQIDERIGGAELWNVLPNPKAVARLREAHAVESSKQVREALAKLLALHGEPVEPEPKKSIGEIEQFGAFEAILATKPKSIKLPSAPWLDPETLPPLFTKDGSTLSNLAVTWILQRQARQAGNLHEEVEEILSFLDRSKNAAFAHSLLDQWFRSEMSAGTRWALDVACIVGNDGIIPRLTEPIPHWCKANRGSRAEWAVHAIALLGSETALGALDGLIHKYRSHRKYVAAAASTAIQTAAAILGISDDELAERITPDFGFDSDGSCEFDSGEGKSVAMLNSDFKILWLHPDSGEVQSKPPAKLTSAAEDEWKQIRKSVKDVASRHTSRLQDAMISRRRWSIEPWRKRFENHPVFRIFAMRLIWGVYDDSGLLIRTFRLYPNGLTASADGNLEEFTGEVSTIGLIHGCELDEGSRKSWSSHLRRFKIKPPFPQIDRPVYELNPLHGNRKEVRLTNGVRIPAGKLRTDLLEHGWLVGSPENGGWVRCMYRRFPTCGIDAYLPVADFHAASLKVDQVLLGSAFFTRAKTGKKSYRDQLNEAIPVPFEQVPPIIYSEVMANLTSLIKA